MSEEYGLVRAPVPISGSWGSHGGLGDQAEIATPNRPFLRGRGATADALNGSARELGHGVRNHVLPRAAITKKNKTVKTPVDPS